MTKINVMVITIQGLPYYTLGFQRTAALTNRSDVTIVPFFFINELLQFKQHM